MNIKKIINFIKNRYAPRGAKPSFSQAGEDLIISHGLSILGIKTPTYIDIGCHHPIFANNTYLFYSQGGHGVIVEPIKTLCSIIVQKRPRDICMQAGAGKEPASIPFYEFSQSTRSTFSAEQARQWEESSGQKPTVSTIQLFPLDAILKQHFINKCPDVVSIDAEGYDEEILSAFSFTCRPKFFCVETTNYITGQLPERNRGLYDFFSKNNYFPYAETPSNTIFADSKAWLK